MPNAYFSRQFIEVFSEKGCRSRQIFMKWNLIRKEVSPYCIPIQTRNKVGKSIPSDVINDPLGQTHYQRSRLNFVLFCLIFKKWGRRYGRIDNTCMAVTVGRPRGSKSIPSDVIRFLGPKISGIRVRNTVLKKLEKLHLSMQLQIGKDFPVFLVLLDRCMSFSSGLADLFCFLVLSRGLYQLLTRETQ